MRGLAIEILELRYAMSSYEGILLLREKFKLRLRQIREIAFFEQLKARVSTKVKGNILISKGSRIQLDPGARVKVAKGSLYIGGKWARRDPFRTFVYVAENGILSVENNFSIGSGSRIHVMSGATLELGDGYANHEFKVDCFERISIGRRVAIASNVTIRDSDNKARSKGEAAVNLPIVIGDDVWIGMNVTILKGVTIGNGAIVGAGSVVVRDVPARTLVAGVPAKLLKRNVDWFDK